MKTIPKWRIVLCALAILVVAALAVTVVMLRNEKSTGIPVTVSAGVEGDMSSYTSINGVVTLGDHLYASDETGRRVYKLSLSGEVLKTYTSERQINNVTTDGVYVYALEGGLDGTVVKLSPELAVEAVAEVGHTPSDLAVIADKGYVANRFSNTVSVLSLSNMTVSATVAIDGREPIAATTDGKDVYVACHLPDESTAESVMSANINVISSTTDTVTKIIPMINGSSGVKDICVDPARKRIYISHIVGRYAYPTTQLDRAWINSNCFSVLDTASGEILCTVLLDEVDQGAANPWGITVSEDGKTLCVALSGLHEVMLVDITEMNVRIWAVEKQVSSAMVGSLSNVVDYLPFLNGCRRRITVGEGVRAITEKNGVLYCGNYFDGTVSAVNLASGATSTLRFVEQPEASAVRMGQMLWSDANNCYQRWQSCNSCHPDAVVDGFNWDNLNDGIGGGGKSARSMLYTHRTPPVMSTGIRPSAEVAVAAGMKFIQFNTLDEEKLAMIDEYLKYLYPQSSPALNRDGTLTESAEAGKVLFEKNCASCHPAPLYTDNNLYDVGTKHFGGDSGVYDVPTLNEVWRTAPYLHDGSLNTIEEVVKFFAKDLTETEVKQLADFVRSIGAEGEVYGVEQAHFTAEDGTTFYNQYQAGATLERVIIRRQIATEDTAVTVKITILDQDGNQVSYAEAEITDLGLHNTAVIVPGEDMILPAGGSYTIAFYDVRENPVATPLTFSAQGK